jgi:hypothetical protein
VVRLGDDGQGQCRDRDGHGHAHRHRGPDEGRSVGLTPRSWLMGQDPVAELHRDRHAEVGRCICNLIGV